MKIRAFITMILALATAQIWAFPAPKLGCNSSSYERGMQDLIHKTSVIGGTTEAPDDGRMALLDLARKLRWSKNKIKTALKNSGKIHCPWTGPQGASSALIGEPGLTMGTSLHIFFKDNGQPKAPYEQWRKCYFKNYAGDRRNLIFAEGTYRLGTPGSPNDDWALVRISEKIEGANGFGVDHSENVLTPETKIVNISKPQRGMKTTVRETRAVGQSCSTKNLFEPSIADGNQRNIILTDCDSSPGASGSVLLAERGEELIAVGIVRGGALSGFDGQPYDTTDVYTKAVAVDGQMIIDLDRIGRHPVQTANAN